MDGCLVSVKAARRRAKSRLCGGRWLVRYLSEGTPSLRDVAKVTASLAEHEWRRREGLVDRTAGVLPPNYV